MAEIAGLEIANHGDVRGVGAVDVRTVFEVRCHGGRRQPELDSGICLEGEHVVARSWSVERPGELPARDFRIPEVRGVERRRRLLVPRRASLVREARWERDGE